MRHNPANWNAPPNASQSSRIWNFERLEQRNLFAADFLGFSVDSEISSDDDTDAANALEICRVSPQSNQSFGSVTFREITTENRVRDDSTHQFNTDEVFSSWPFDGELAKVG